MLMTGKVNFGTAEKALGNVRDGKGIKMLTQGPDGEITAEVRGHSSVRLVV